MDYQVKETLVSLGIVIAILLATPALAFIGLVIQFSFIAGVPAFLIAAVVSQRFRRWLEQPPINSLASR
jgi:hypothetical protein